MGLVALDLGSASIKTLAFRGPNEDRPSITGAGIATTPENMFSSTVKLSEAIKESMAMAGVRSGDAVVSLDGPKTLVRRSTMMAMPRDYMREALKLSAKDKVSVPVDNMTLDFIPLRKPKRDPVSAEGWIVGVDNDVANMVVQSCIKAGLEVSRIDLAPFALARTLQPVYREHETTVVFDVGDMATDAVVVDTEGLPTFVRSMAMGGADMTNDIMEVVGVDFDQAMALKEQIGLKTPPAGDMKAAAVSESVRKSAKRLIVGIRSTIEWWENKNNAKIDKVVITGGVSRMEGFAQAVGIASRLPYSEFALTRGRSAVRMMIEDRKSAELLTADPGLFATAIGLTLGPRDRKAKK